jgi:hypothetical protein
MAKITLVECEASECEHNEKMNCKIDAVYVNEGGRCSNYSRGNNDT